jgi:hypothetical protein
MRAPGLVAFVLLAACGRDRLEGKIRIAFGDCAPIDTRFVSGPRPTWFDDGELAHDWDKLGQTLGQHGQSAFFVDRDDIQVAGEGRATTYAHVMRAIEVARHRLQPCALHRAARPQL